MLKYKPKIGCG